MKDLNHFYTKRKNEFFEKTGTLQRRAGLISWARIFVAMVFVVLIYLSFDSTRYAYALLPVAITFAYLVSAHSKIQDQLNFLRNLIRLNDLELKGLTHDYSGFDDGQEYVDTGHGYSYDLDLFGQGSLFQYINRSGTGIGQDHLAASFMAPLHAGEEIESRQAGIKELADKIELRQFFWAHGLRNSGNQDKSDRLSTWLSDKNNIFEKRGYEVVLILFPIIGLTCLFLTIYSMAYLPLLLLSIGVQFTITALHSGMVSEYENILTRYQKVFEKYALLLHEIDTTNFSSPLLIKIKTESKIAAEQIRKFSKLVNAFESRRNAMAYAFGNGFYLYDLQYIYQLEKWRKENASKVSAWLEKIAETDALISLATFFFNNRDNTFPKMQTGLVIEASDLSHPLITKAERVGNTFNIGNSEKIMLITGANMAGKSTFLRAVGVNLVLALTGSSVCANEFACPLIKLATSMRTTDSLVEHQSYFYAELNRLKSVMKQVHSGAPLLILLDEMLRGTNSNDKHDGSVGLVKQFVSSKALVMLATHDVALGELAEEFPKVIHNYCFESEIKNDTLSFDYKLHSGVARRTNATFLMRKMGILTKSNL